MLYYFFRGSDILFNATLSESRPSLSQKNVFTKYEEIIEKHRLQVKRLPEFLQLSIRQGGRREWIGGELVYFA